MGRSDPILPPGRPVELPGRGTTFVREVDGPRGAPTLVLLHGLGATAGLNWFQCFRPLGRCFRVVAMDVRGHGRGIVGRRRFRLSDCADDVEALASALGIERFVAVGYSMGGPIAKLLWRRHRARVSGLVLCATARRFGSPLAQRVSRAAAPLVSACARAVPTRARRRLANPAHAAWIPDPAIRRWVRAELRGSDPAALIEAGWALWRFSSQGWVGEIDVPAAVVVTERDRLVPPARQQRLAAGIPGATVHPVAEGHFACARRPDLFVPALLDACRAVAFPAAAATPLVADLQAMVHGGQI